MAVPKAGPKKPIAPEPGPPVEETPVVPPEGDPETEPPAEEPTDKITLVNPGNSAVVYSLDGRMLGGGESAEVEEIDEVGQAAIDRGYLMRR